MATLYTTPPIKMGKEFLSIKVQKNKKTGLIDLLIPQEFNSYLKNTPFHPDDEKRYHTLEAAKLFAMLIRTKVEENYKNSKK